MSKQNNIQDIEMNNVSNDANGQANKKNKTQKSTKKSSKGNFSVSLEQLQDLFKPDNIRDKKSNAKLEKLGGITELSSKLCTDLEKGIDVKKSNIQSKRIQKYGKNDPIITERKTILQLVIENFEEDLLLRILTVAAIVSLLVGILKDGVKTGWMEGFTILVACILIVTVTVTNNYMKEKKFEQLNQKLEQRNVKVIRNGKNQFISVFDLLVGDLMCVQIGEIFPVDGILISGNECNVDESSQTGESDLLRKMPAIEIEEKLKNQGSAEIKETPFLISGSRLVEGQGIMLVCAVGLNTQSGLIRESLQIQKTATPLQEKLERVANEISFFGLYSAILTVAILIVHILIKCYQGEQILMSLQTVKMIINVFIIGVAIVVVAVPEGLPLAVTISLAYSVGKMKDENNLVRHLSACEIMGGANNICSDKTGTLTENRMKVNLLYIEEAVKKHSEINSKEVSQKNLELFCETVCLNSTADVRKSKNKQSKVLEQIGNKTECALLEVCIHIGFHYEDIRKLDKVIKVIPFSSERKRMTSIYKLQNGQIRVAMKGASEIVLQKCTQIVSKNSQIKQLSQEQRDDIKVSIIDKFSKSALRTITMAYKDLDPSTNLQSLTNEDFEKDMILVGIAGIKDNLRDGVKEAVKKCKVAGITVRMVTGDNILTAEAIAKESGILDKDYDKQIKSKKENYAVMEGQKFRELVGQIVYENPQKKIGPKVQNLENFIKIQQQLRVLARSTPIDKLILVTGLIQMKQIVAVTGDGSNDAPALKNADIGFAMGIEGTEIAKEAAGIILLDDNFSSIVTACKWGRNIYDSIRKFIQFQLTCNIVALAMAFLGAIILKESPLNPIQMLWVNLIMDTFASLALATEPPHENLLKRSPYKRSDSIVSPTMWKNIIMQAVFQIIILNAILFKGPDFFNVPSSKNNDPFDIALGQHYTLFFQIFVFLQVFNEINCRKLKNEEKNVFEGFFNNNLFLFIIVVTIIVQMTLVEFGKGFIKCSPLNWQQHGICILMGTASIIWGFIIKFIPDEPFSKINFFSGTASEMDEQNEVGDDEEKRLSQSLLRSLSNRSQNSNLDSDIPSQLRTKYTKRVSVTETEVKTQQQPIQPQKKKSKKKKQQKDDDE